MNDESALFLLNIMVRLPNWLEVKPRNNRICYSNPDYLFFKFKANLLSLVKEGKYLNLHLKLITDLWSEADAIEIVFLFFFCH